jgi:hypothetical protein
VLITAAQHVEVERAPGSQKSAGSEEICGVFGRPARSTRKTRREGAICCTGLHDVGLDHLVERLDEWEAWDQTLSRGAKQRFAFSRMFL